MIMIRVEWLMDRIPPPPPDVSEKDDKKRLAKKNMSIWSIFKRKA